MAASAVEYLGATDARTESFTFTLSDGNGGLVTRTVDVTIQGSNDAVLVSGTPVDSGAVVEDGAASASGTVAFTDVDLSDVHLVSAALDTSDYGTQMGTFTAVKTTDTTGTGSGGLVSWSYAIDNAAAQQLAAGQVVTEVHTITIDDQNGDTVTQDVTVTITGTNDAVLVSGTPVDGGAVVEDGAASASGTVAFTDVDLSDVHLVSAALDTSDYGTPMGTFTAVKTTDTTGTGSGGLVSWSYAIDNARRNSWPPARW